MPLPPMPMKPPGPPSGGPSPAMPSPSGMPPAGVPQPLAGAMPGGSPAQGPNPEQKKQLIMRLAEQLKRMAESESIDLSPFFSSPSAPSGPPQKSPPMAQ